MVVYHGDVLAGAGAKVYDIAPVVCLLFHLLAQPAAAVVGCFPVAGSGWWGCRSGLRIVAMAEVRRELSVPAHSAREVVRKSFAGRAGWQERPGGGLEQLLCAWWCGLARRESVAGVRDTDANEASRVRVRVCVYAARYVRMQMLGWWRVVEIAMQAWRVECCSEALSSGYGYKFSCLQALLLCVVSRAADYCTSRNKRRQARSVARASGGCDAWPRGEEIDSDVRAAAAASFERRVTGWVAGPGKQRFLVAAPALLLPFFEKRQRTTISPHV